MVVSGVDFSFARIPAANLKADGYRFACRYLASSNGKRVTAGEVDDFKANGIGLVLVWEDAADGALAGFNQGQHDAQLAISQASMIGWPSDLPIYFAVDFDASEAQQGTLNDYLRGAASVLGVNRVGIYGGYHVVKRCLDAGVATFAWQTLAWSGGQIDPRVHIYQNGQSAYGGSADIDEARQTNFGQWEEDMGRVLKRDDILNYWHIELPDSDPPEDYIAAWLDKNGIDLFYDLCNNVPQWYKNVRQKTQPTQPKPPTPSQPITDVTPTPKPLPQLDPITIPRSSQSFWSKLWKVLFG